MPDIDQNLAPPKTSLRRTVSQLMVLVNGLILTGLLFYVSSNFVGKMVRDEYEQNFTSTTKSVSEKLQTADAVFQSLRTILEVSDLNNAGTIINNIRTQGKLLEQFDQVLWMPVENPLNPISLKSSPQSNDAYMVDITKPVPALIEQIYRH